MEVGAWLYDNFDVASGVSFLPFADHTYQQAPYQDIDADEYLEWNGRVPKSLDWTKFSMYEKEDNANENKTSYFVKFRKPTIKLDYGVGCSVKLTFETKFYSFKPKDTDTLQGFTTKLYSCRIDM